MGLKVSIIVASLEQLGKAKRTKKIGYPLRLESLDYTTHLTTTSATKLRAQWRATESDSGMKLQTSWKPRLPLGILD